MDSGKKCPNCGAEIKAGGRFCKKCGSSLAGFAGAAQARTEGAGEGYKKAAASAAAFGAAGAAGSAVRADDGNYAGQAAEGGYKKSVSGYSGTRVDSPNGNWAQRTAGSYSEGADAYSDASRAGLRPEGGYSSAGRYSNVTGGYSYGADAYSAASDSALRSENRYASAADGKMQPEEDVYYPDDDDYGDYGLEDEAEDGAEDYAEERGGYSRDGGRRNKKRSHLPLIPIIVAALAIGAAAALAVFMGPKLISRLKGNESGKSVQESGADLGASAESGLSDFGADGISGLESTEASAKAEVSEEDTSIGEASEETLSGGSAAENLGSGEIGAAASAAGRTQDEAAPIEVGEKITGTYTGAGEWYCFTAGEEESAYSITVTNGTKGAEALECTLCDEDGAEVELSEGGNTISADDSGKAATGIYTSLEAGETYYIMLQSESDEVGYSLKVRQRDDVDAGFAMAMKQVNFKPDSMTEFYDEEAARATLSQVAELLNKYPDHKVLLAGTTATTWNKAMNIETSRLRAETVKNILVNEYGVSADQLITAGLGDDNDPFPRAEDVDANGNGVEPGATHNRRVVIVDAEDATAQQVING